MNRNTCWMSETQLFAANYQLLQSVETMSPGLYCSPSMLQRQSDSCTHTPSWEFWKIVNNKDLIPDILCM